MSDDRLERIEDKIDQLGDRLNKIDVTLAAQHVSLETHIKRSDTLEAIVIPMKEQMSETKGAIKLMKLIALLAAIAETVHIWISK